MPLQYYTQPDHKIIDSSRVDLEGPLVELAVAFRLLNSSAGKISAFAQGGAKQ
jgi:hypothetical protein